MTILETKYLRQGISGQKQQLPCVAYKLFIQFTKKAF